MRIALIQQPASPDLQANRRKGLDAVEEAADRGAQIICFAELAFDPFYPQEPATPDKLDRAEPIPGPTTASFAARARARGVVIILNLFERNGGHTYDASPVIDADGKILGVTRMVHITDYPGFHEKGYYTPGKPGDTGAPPSRRPEGKGMTVYETAFGRIGVAICYDRHFPECMRSLALNHAQVVFVPQAGVGGEWPEGMYEAEIRVASFQNGYYTALCNRVGPESHLTFSGSSFVCDPTGTIIARIGGGTTEILLCDLNLDLVAQSPARKLFIPDRRPELYADWLSEPLSTKPGS